MTPLHTMVVGTSVPQDFQITNDGAALVGTGLTIGIEFSAGSAIDDDDVTVAWLSQAVGTVRVTDVDEMPLGWHKFRWTLTDSGGKKGYVPNLESAPHIWRVVAV